MNVQSMTVPRLEPNFAPTLKEVVIRALPEIAERMIVVVTSKIVAICEGRFVRDTGDSRVKDTLIEEEADQWLPRSLSDFGIVLTIKNNRLVPTAGIDESNSGGFYILWPADPQASANQLRKQLAEHFQLNELGVLITDSTTAPLRSGTTGICLAHSGFAALKNYIGNPDLFGRELKVTKANLAEGLAAAAVFTMGEGSERTPLATITDLPALIFQNRNPTAEELADLTIEPDKDLYAPLLKTAPWQEKRL